MLHPDKILIKNYSKFLFFLLWLGFFGLGFYVGVFGFLGCWGCLGFLFLGCYILWVLFFNVSRKFSLNLNLYQINNCSNHTGARL